MAKENFECVQLIEAHNSIFNYDFISICETSLNDSVELPETLLVSTSLCLQTILQTQDMVEWHSYKNSLPVIVRYDVSFDESIFTVLYRNPSSNHASPEFQTFLANFEHFYSQIKAEKPLATFFTGDFNAHAQLWWPNGDTTPEGSGDISTLLGLSQLISEPINFEHHKNPSCIDLIIADQPSRILDSGTRPSLDPYCHHQIIYGKINFRIHPPPFQRKFGILIELTQLLVKGV